MNYFQIFNKISFQQSTKYREQLQNLQSLHIRKMTDICYLSSPPSLYTLQHFNVTQIANIPNIRTKILILRPSILSFNQPPATSSSLCDTNKVTIKSEQGQMVERNNLLANSLLFLQHYVYDRESVTFCLPTHQDIYGR